MAYMLGAKHELALKLSKILGVKNARCIELRCHVSEIVTARIEVAVDEEQMAKIVDAVQEHRAEIDVRQYVLCPRCSREISVGKPNQHGLLTKYQGSEVTLCWTCAGELGLADVIHWEGER
jgi:hypothetical protein